MISIFTRKFLKTQKETYKNLLSIIILPLFISQILYERLFISNYRYESSPKIINLIDSIWTPCILHESKWICMEFQGIMGKMLPAIIVGNLAVIYMAIILIDIFKKAKKL